LTRVEFSGDGAALDSLIDELDRQEGQSGRMSPALVTALAIRSIHPIDDVESFLTRFRKAVLAATSEDTRQVPFRFGQLCRAVVQLVANHRQFAASMVLPMRTAVIKSQPSPGHITPALAGFLGLCFLSQNYIVAERELKIKRLKIDVLETGVNVSDVSLSLYYSGMIYLALKRFTEATQSFRLVFAVPSHAVTDLMVDAVKRIHVSSLLAFGTASNVIRNTSLSRQVNAHCMLVGGKSSSNPMTLPHTRFVAMPTVQRACHYVRAMLSIRAPDLYREE